MALTIIKGPGSQGFEPPWLFDLINEKPTKRLPYEKEKVLNHLAPKEAKSVQPKSPT